MVKKPTANAGDVRDMGLIPRWGRSPGVGCMQPTPVFLPGESHGQRSLAGYSPRGREESDTTERPHFSRFPWSVSPLDSLSGSDTTERLHFSRFPRSVSPLDSLSGAPRHKNHIWTIDIYCLCFISTSYQGGAFFIAVKSVPTSLSPFLHYHFHQYFG